MSIFDKFEHLRRWRRRFGEHDCRVTFDGDDACYVAIISVSGMQVGHADLIIDGANAKLVDIVIQRSLPHWYPMLRPLWWLIRVNYRGRGIGSVLMKRTLAQLHSRGVKRVWGRLGGGDPALQAPWYRRHGFLVDQTTGRIERSL